MNDTSNPPATRIRLPVFAAIIAYAFVMRVLPYVLHKGFGMEVTFAYTFFHWMITPIYALSIFGGAMLSRKAAIALPLVVYFASDVVIALLMEPAWGAYRSQPAIYAAFVVLVMCGMPLRSERGAIGIATAGIFGAALFFLITNLGVWITSGGYGHPLTVNGLLLCYRDGLPFFRPTLISMAVFLPVMFSPLVMRRAARHQPSGHLV